MTGKMISAVIGTAGHVDHGKTTLVKVLTGVDTDTLAEEKKRGVSINLGFAHLDFPVGKEPVRAAIVDVPGHERFIKNMLAGVTGIDIVLFVVAADDGIMPQTLEHLDIVRLLGIRRVVFAITKTDLVDEKRACEVREDIKRLVNQSWLNWRDCLNLQGDGAPGAFPIVAVSAVDGRGIEELKNLIFSLAAGVDRAGGGPFFRLPVDRSFSVKGFGTVVTGTVSSGAVRRGDEAVCYPSGARVKIRGMQSLHAEALSASAGQRAALNISGVGHGDIARGDVVADQRLLTCVHHAQGSSALHVDCLFELLVGSRAGQRLNIKRRSIVKVHHLTDETLATLLLRPDKECASETGVHRVWGRLILKKPLLMLRGDRFIMRDPSRNMTIGGGVAGIPYYSKELLQRFGQTRFPHIKEAGLAAVNKESIDDVLSYLIAPSAPGFYVNSLSAVLNIAGDELYSLLAGSRVFTLLGSFVLSTERLSALKDKIIGEVLSYNASNAMEPGISEAGLLKAVGPLVSHGIARQRAGELFRVVVDRLVEEKSLKKSDGYISLPSHRSAPTGSEAVERAILALFNKEFVSVSASEIHATQPGKPSADKVLQYLQRTGAVVRIKEGVFLSGRDINAARERLTGYLASSRSIKAAEFRDLLGCGRKLAIEILEYFDRERVTLRSGDIRTLR